MTYDALIVTYNCESVIGDTIQSLLACDPAPQKIIIVDSCSQDKTVEVIKKRFPKVKLLPQTQNIGFGRGNNIGLNYVESPFVLLVNPDLTVTQAMAKNLIATLEQDPQIAAVSPIIYTQKKQKSLYSYGAILTDQGFGYHATPQTKTINSFTGACSLLRSDILKKYRFCHEFFLYYEEAELATRLLRDGYSFSRNKDAECYHLVGHSGPQEDAAAIGFRQFYAIQNRWYTLGSLWPAQLLLKAVFYNLLHSSYFLLFYVRQQQWSRLALIWLIPTQFLKGLLHRRSDPLAVPQWYHALQPLHWSEMNQIKDQVISNKP